MIPATFVFLCLVGLAIWARIQWNKMMDQFTLAGRGVPHWSEAK